MQMLNASCSTPCSLDWHWCLCTSLGLSGTWSEVICTTWTSTKSSSPCTFHHKSWPNTQACYWMMGAMSCKSSNCVTNLYQMASCRWHIIFNCNIRNCYKKLWKSWQRSLLLSQSASLWISYLVVNTVQLQARKIDSGWLTVSWPTCLVKPVLQT